MVRWGIAAWSARIGESSSRSFREKESKGVERYIRSARKYAHRATNVEHRDMMDRGIMPLPVLTRLCRHLPKRDFSDILEQLVSGGLVGTKEREEDSLETFWPLG
jgi:hypothetical protein